MNLPLINNDNVGNSYYGWRTNNLLYAPDSVALTTAKLATWINNFFGQTCAFTNNVFVLNVTFPTSFESLTLPATSSNYRFDLSGIETTTAANRVFSMRISYPSIGSGSNGAGFDGSGNVNTAFYCVLNNRSLSVFSITRNGADLVSGSGSFVSYGWLNNSIYSGSAFVRSAYVLVLHSSPSQNLGRRPSAENTNIASNFRIPQPQNADPIANYPISCQSATPGANATEFYLRDNAAPNKAIGYVPNLLKTSLQIPVGQVYRNTGIDPDGSNMNTWLCVGVLGSERILMRVWTQGLV